DDGSGCPWLPATLRRIGSPTIGAERPPEESFARASSPSGALPTESRSSRCLIRTGKPGPPPPWSGLLSLGLHEEGFNGPQGPAGQGLRVRPPWAPGPGMPGARVDGGGLGRSAMIRGESAPGGGRTVLRLEIGTIHMGPPSAGELKERIVAEALRIVRDD